jgi:hypothetical protein
VLRITDGALWIVLTAEGVTLSWQEAGDRYGWIGPARVSRRHYSSPLLV